MDTITRWGMLGALWLSGSAACSGARSTTVGDGLGAASRDAAIDDAAGQDAGAPASEQDAGSSELGEGDAGPGVDGGEPDASDGAATADDAGLCDLGTAQNGATADNLNLFGEVTWFAGGAALPAGRYRVRYLDGCMKYGQGQDWTVHAYADGSIAWWIVDDASQNLTMAPGTSGYAASNGAYAEFEDCVAANLAGNAPVELDYAGGRLGVLVRDNPVYDNMPGLDGRNPSYRLEAVDACIAVLPDASVGT